MTLNLTPNEAKRLLVDIFKKQAMWERSLLITEVERMHLQRGGNITAQSPATAVKKALSSLKNEGLIANIGKGLWAMVVERFPKDTSNDLQITQQLGIPLQPVYARNSILKLLGEQNSWQRTELAKRLEADHLAAGNVLGTQDTLTVTKKALTYLQDAGYVQSDGRGNWSLKNTTGVEQQFADRYPIDAPTTNQQTQPTTINDGRIVLGDGAESVYLYYFENDKELAKLKGKDTWDCKIGRAGADVDQRVSDQARTSRSKRPMIAVVIRTDQAFYLEQVIHNSLKIVDRHIVGERGHTGVEWFDTNPERLIAWWRGYAELLSNLVR